MKDLAKKPTYLPATIIVLLAFLLYANTFTHGFVFDDTAVLTGHRDVKKGLSGLPDIFTKGSWQGYEPDSDMHIYRPMQLTALALQHQIFGLKASAYHVVHVISYALLCFLVYRLLLSLFAPYDYGNRLAFIATFLFTIHPVHTEVVANIKGNGDLLAMLFGILSLHCLHKYAHKESTLGQASYLALGAFCFLLALLTKETIVSFVGAGIFILYFFSKLSIKRIVLSVAPMLAMVGLYLLIRSSVFGENPNELTDTSVYSNVVLLADTTSQQIGTRLYALGKNLQLLTLPYPLVVMYVYNSVPIVEAWDIRAIFALAAYILLGIALLCNLQRGNIWGFALAFFFTTLALFTNLIFTIPNIVSERWLLIPSLGVSIAVGYALLKLYALSPRTTIGLASLIFIGYAGYTIERNRAWESNLTLGLTDVQTAPRNIIVNRMVALSQMDAARKDNMNPEKLRSVIAAYQRMLIDAPNDASMYFKLAQTYELIEDYRLAADTYGKASSYYSEVRADAQRNYLKTLIMSQQYQRAVDFVKSTQLEEPRSLDNLPNLTLAHAATGDNEGALNQYQNFYEVLQTIPGNSQPPAYLQLNALGLQLEKVQAHTLAAQAFGDAARSASPIQGKALFSEAKNLNLAGQYRTAIAKWTQLATAYPTEMEVISQRAIALAGDGQIEAAQQDFDQYVSILSQQSAASDVLLNNLGIALENAKAYTMAARAFELAAAAASADSQVKAPARFSEAKNLILAKHYEDALAKWQALRADFPSLPIVRLEEAKALEATQQEAQARIAYQTVLDLIEEQDRHWEDAPLRRQADRALLKLDTAAEIFYQKTIAEIQERQRTQPETAIHNNLNRLGIQLEQRGAHRLAAKVFTQLATLDSPLRGKALFAEAKNLNLAKDYAIAAPKWRRLNELYPNIVDVLMGAAKAHDAIGNTSSAMAYYQQALKLISPEQMSDTYAEYKKIAEAKLSNQQ
ncbi:hypothetical protein QEH59_14145 [Coraliomargarita sp. SDUM461004]|uniref:Dolichyl-phosphate-mannose--protein mannosyltransferase n=1 Tax=Thalassobacterium sedimentorum TaxID=3041258 RepID=A0ABU1AL90_9BACT|nr:hypothetical protein [Coraliomargarita sp. SDUM461004]MDQ8195570.1 hypothetical protein [Coraliomargarita sp. SDUM461004]